MVVSLSVKNGISSVVLLDKGVVVNKSVKKVKNSDNHNIEELLNTFKRSILLVKPYVEDGTTDTVEFELNNRTVIKWIVENSPTKTFEEPFIEAMEMLSSLAVRYSLRYSKVTIASKYKSCSKSEVTGLSELLEG